MSVVFWNTKTGSRYVELVKNLVAIAGSGDNCVLISAADPESAPVDAGAMMGNGYVVSLRNAIGSPVETCHSTIPPDFVTMTSSHVVFASALTLFLWPYRVAAPKMMSDASSSALGSRGGSNSEVSGRATTFRIDDNAPNATTNPICCVAASATTLLVGRENGTVHHYSLPSVTIERIYKLRCRPAQIQLNSDSTRFSIIDGGCVLTFFDLEARSASSSGESVIGAHLEPERKDIWVSSALFCMSCYGKG